MKKQKGQSLVEFALVIPFFLLLIFGLIYSGMLFHDYTSLSNTARSAAREAAILPATASEADYNDIQSHYSGQGQSTITSLYSQQSFTVKKEGSGNDIYVKATIHMVRTVTSPVMRIVLPPSFDIVYFMKKDTPSTNTNTNNPPSGGDG